MTAYPSTCPTCRTNPAPADQSVGSVFLFIAAGKSYEVQDVARVNITNWLTPLEPRTIVVCEDYARAIWSI